MITVVLLGAGNVAKHLYDAFSNAENVVVHQWYNRTLSAISSYANQTSITDKLENLQKADIYIIAVSDDHIKAISQALPFKDRLVVHTSGSVGIHDLDKKNEIGVFYPLQTFSKERETRMKEVPICIEVYNKQNFKILKDLATAIGCESHKIYTDQRRSIHLAAVFLNNFTNQLYRIGHEICEANNVDFNLMKPLILETAKKVQNLSPYRAQTGPAKRNDKKTIKRHLKQLENEEHKAIYKLLTASIKRTHGQR